ncbi:hypothetical protein QZH41_004877 [Actinostola sp. cb2023]|nr:hypothetical protein QZH41_004877 [Actinostola sp. cb2023]
MMEVSQLFSLRGHNVVALNQEGTFLHKKSFDTYGDPSAGAKLDAFIKALPRNTIVLVSVHDSGNAYVSSEAQGALRSIYAADPIIPSYRGSWALIGYKGSPRPSWIRQAYNQKGLGPTVISASIPLYGK